MSWRGEAGKGGVGKGGALGSWMWYWGASGTGGLLSASLPDVGCPWGGGGQGWVLQPVTSNDYLESNSSIFASYL